MVNMPHCNDNPKGRRRKIKSSNITNYFLKWTRITQDQFAFHIVKFGLTMEFVSVPLNFSPSETKIIDAEISKLLSKDVIVSTTTEPNDYHFTKNEIFHEGFFQ